MESDWEVCRGWPASLMDVFQDPDPWQKTNPLGKCVAQKCQPNLIGRGFVLETNVPENAKLNGQLLWITLMIVIQFRQKNQRTSCSLQRKHSMYF